MVSLTKMAKTHNWLFCPQKIGDGGGDDAMFQKGISFYFLHISDSWLKWPKQGAG